MDTRELKRGLVSVIIPTYNSERQIEKTLRSVLAQDYECYEILVVDDCSLDRTRQIVEEWAEQDERIKLLALEKNGGAAVSRNFGLQEAQGQYVAFLDSDDAWLPGKLSKQLVFMKQYPTSGFSFTGYRRENEDGEHLNVIHVPESITYKGLLKNTIIGCSTVMIDREIIGDFRMPLLRKGQDTATWLMLMKRTATAHGLDEVLMAYTVREGSISANKWGAMKRMWTVYRDVERLELSQSLFYFSFYVFNAIRKRAVRG